MHHGKHFLANVFLMKKHSSKSWNWPLFWEFCIFFLENNPNDMMGRCLRIGGVWVRHANNSCNFDPRTKLGDKCKGGTHQRTFFEFRSLGGTLVKPWWNLGRTLVERSADFFGNPRRICPREPETPRNLEWNSGTMVKPWWNLLRNLLAAQDRRAPKKAKTPQNLGWNFGGTLVKAWWNLGVTLQKLAFFCGSRRRICLREPGRVRKQFCPETFTMAEDPKAHSCWGKNLFLQLNAAWQTQKGIRIWNISKATETTQTMFNFFCTQAALIGTIVAVKIILYQRYYLLQRHCTTFFLAPLPIELKALSVREALVILKDNVCK